MKLLAVSALSLVGVSAFAQESKPFEFRATGLSWSMITESESENKRSSLAVRPDNFEFVAHWDAVNFYFGLGATNNFSVGYMVMPELEAGLMLGYSSKTTEPKGGDKVTNDNTSVGIFGRYHLALNPGMKVELLAKVASISGKNATVETDGNTTTTTTAKTLNGLDWGANAALVVAVDATWDYVASVGYEVANRDYKNPNSETKTGTVSIVPLGMRFHF